MKFEKIWTNICVLIFTLLFYCNKALEKAHIETFQVPPLVRRHDDVALICEHNIPHDRLLSVTWFHNGEEVYRYDKQEDNNKAIFDDSGLDVNGKESNEQRMTLSNVNLTATGTYKCQIIRDGDDGLISVDETESNMTVMVIPKENPTIEPQPLDDLPIGSNMEINCTSPPSLPKTDLEWTVNGRKAPEKHLIEYPVEETEEGLFITKLGLKFRLFKRHFKRSKLNLKCQAKIFSYYTASGEHSHSELASGASDLGVFQPIGRWFWSPSIFGSSCNTFILCLVYLFYHIPWELGLIQ